MPGVFGPILTTGVVLGTAAVVVANPVNPPRADIRIPALASSDARAAADMLDENFLSALAPEPAGPTNPVAVLKDLVAVLVASAAYLGRNVVGAEVAETGVQPELTAASYPYFGDAPGWQDVAPLVATAGTGLSVAEGSGEVEVAPSPSLALNASSFVSVQDWVDADLPRAFDKASAVVSELSDALPGVGDSALAGERLRSLSEMVGSVKDSVETDLSMLGDLSATAVSTVRAGVLPPQKPQHPRIFSDAVNVPDDADAKRDSTPHAIEPNGPSGAPRASIGHPGGGAAARNGE